jgi:hypothetical protein
VCVCLFEVHEKKNGRGHLVCVASVARRRRLKVNERDMTEEDEMLLREAKAKDRNPLIENDAAEVCKKAGILKEHIIGSRRALTAKKGGTRNARLRTIWPQGS